jgi:hypothetical protein
VSFQLPYKSGRNKVSECRNRPPRRLTCCSSTPARRTAMAPPDTLRTRVWSSGRRGGSALWAWAQQGSANLGPRFRDPVSSQGSNTSRQFLRSGVEPGSQPGGERLRGFNSLGDEMNQRCGRWAQQDPAYLVLRNPQQSGVPRRLLCGLVRWQLQGRPARHGFQRHYCSRRRGFLGHELI